MIRSAVLGSLGVLALVGPLACQGPDKYLRPIDNGMGGRPGGGLGGVVVIGLGGAPGLGGFSGLGGAFGLGGAGGLGGRGGGGFTAGAGGRNTGGTTVILRDDPATGSAAATGSAIAPGQAPSSQRGVAAADAGAVAAPHTAAAPARPPELDDAPAPPPVLSRDTTLDPKAAEAAAAAARALLRDRHPAHRGAGSKSGVRHRPTAPTETAPPPAADEEPLEEPTADQ